MITFENIEYLDIAELAETLKMKEAGVRRLLRLGRIAGRKIGLKWYVSTEAVREYLNAIENQG